MATVDTSIIIRFMNRLVNDYAKSESYWEDNQNLSQASLCNVSKHFFILMIDEITRRPLTIETSRRVMRIWNKRLFNGNGSGLNLVQSLRVPIPPDPIVRISEDDNRNLYFTFIPEPTNDIELEEIAHLLVYFRVDLSKVRNDWIELGKDEASIDKVLFHIKKNDLKFK